MSHNLQSSLSQWFFGSTGPDEIGRWSPLKRLLVFTLVLSLIYLVCWALFQWVTPTYRRALTQTAEGYYSSLGRSFEFLVAGDRLAFRSYQRPAFTADLSISGLATNVPFLLSLLLATPGLLLQNRAWRLALGLIFLFFTQVLFLIVKVEVTLIGAAHPLAGNASFWQGLDNFLEITGKAFFPVVIWLLLTLPYMLGSLDIVEPEAKQTRKVGRNDPCPCGSGKKFKHCCVRR